MSRPQRRRTALDLMPGLLLSLLLLVALLAAYSVPELGVWIYR